MEVWDEQVIPANGIYAGWATLGRRALHGGDQRRRCARSSTAQDVRVEAYLLDFDRDIYGQQLTFSFEKYLRPEAKFDSLEALIAQINADVQASREYLTQSAYGR